MENRPTFYVNLDWQVVREEIEISARASYHLLTNVVRNKHRVMHYSDVVGIGVCIQMRYMMHLKYCRFVLQRLVV